jgi:hypothetical protein
MPRQELGCRRSSGGGWEDSRLCHLHAGHDQHSLPVDDQTEVVRQAGPQDAI